MRREQILRPLKRASFPSQCVWVDTETDAIPGDDGEERHVLRFGWACYRRQLSAGEWSRRQWFRFETQAAFWNWLESKHRDKTALFWLAHNAAYDATVLGAWAELPQRGWELQTAVIDAPPFLAYWKNGKRSLKMLDTLNWWKVKLETIGEKVGLAKISMPSLDAPRKEWDRYCKRDVEVVMAACIRWWEWLREHDLGGSAATLASQALVAFRHRFLTHSILIDANFSALQLARDSYHGGRTEAFRIGDFEGPFYLLDVRSEYPTVMERESYPTILKGVYGGLSLTDLACAVDRYAVVADVELETDAPIYPYNDSSPLLFPVGRFRSVLTSGELRCALDAGHVRGVYQCALYSHAPIFAAYVRELSELRARALERGDRFESWVLKRLLNSLYGKFGQRGRRTERVGVTDDLSCRMWDEVDGETGERYRMRQLAGLIESHHAEGESRYSHPAIAAHVTAYGRLLLWSLIERAGLANVLYCDTDSVLVSEVGHERLRALIGSGGLGTLHLDRIVQHTTIWSPKDYKLDDLQRTKGVRASARWIEPNVVEQEKWLGLRSLLRRGDVSTPVVRREVKHLSRRYDKGVVLSSGLVRPFRLPDESGAWLA